MKKCCFLATLACFFCLPNGTNAQTGTGISKGSVYANVGVAFGRYGAWPDNKLPLSKYYGPDTRIPLTSFSLDIALTKYITVAPFIGYAYTGENHVFSGGNYGYHDWYHHVLLGSKDAVHVPIAAGFSGYIGAVLGIQWSWEHLEYYHDLTQPPSTVTNYQERHLFYDVFVGAKYHINTRAAVFTEVGYGITWGNVGCTLKLN